MPSSSASSTNGFGAALDVRAQLGPSMRAWRKPPGFSARDIAAFYEWFAATTRTVTVYSQGVNQSATGTDKVNAIVNVHLADRPDRHARRWGRSR